ncbi:MAG TPA: hypothetical protein PK833_12565, partial [Vicingus sp.]|nr:hypothetical protein [Vicingus sp.]
ENEQETAKMIKEELYPRSKKKFNTYNEVFQFFKYNKPFQLESGKSLPEFQLGYTTLGKLNAEKNNVIWIT